MARKAAQKRIRVDVGYAEDMRLTGDEPEFSSDANPTTAEMMRALGWYSHHANAENYATWINLWVSENRPADARDVKNSALSCDPTVGKLCRMSQRGLVLNAKQVDMINLWIDRAVKVRAAVTAKAAVTRKNPAQIISEKTDVVFEEIEEAVDNWQTSTLDVFALLRENNAPVLMCNKIRDYYQAIVDELDLAIAGQDDVKEAYAFMSKAKLRKYRAFVAAIVLSATNARAGKVAQRKAPARRKRSAPTTSKMTYLTEDRDLQIVSMSPDKIVGADMLITYNKTFKQIVVLIGETKGSLSVKGSSVVGYDAVKSFKVRVKDSVLQEVAGKPRASALRILGKVKAKRAAATGRIGKTTLLVKAFK